MNPPPPPLDPQPAAPDPELARLQALHSLALLDTPGEDGFDMITELLANAMQVPAALITLVDQDRVWCKSRHGTDLVQFPRLPGLSASVIESDGVYVVEDALADARTCDHPLVTGSFGLRFFAAVPLRLRDHHAVGTLSAVDFKPRTPSRAQLRSLELLGQLATDRMELRRGARRAQGMQRRLHEIEAQLGQSGAHDRLTGAWNLGAVMVLLGQAHARSLRDGGTLAVMMLEVDALGKLQQELGAAAVDQILQAVHVRLKDTLRGGDAIGRVGGERFLCLLESFAVDSARMVAERCRGAVARLPLPVDRGGTPGQAMVSLSIGLILVHPNAGIAPELLVQRAELMLEQSRGEGGNRVSLEVLGTPRQSAA